MFVSNVPHNYATSSCLCQRQSLMMSAMPQCSQYSCQVYQLQETKSQDLRCFGALSICNDRAFGYIVTFCAILLFPMRDSVLQGAACPVTRDRPSTTNCNFICSYKLQRTSFNTLIVFFIASYLIRSIGLCFNRLESVLFMFYNH